MRKLLLLGLLFSWIVVANGQEVYKRVKIEEPLSNPLLKGLSIDHVHVEKGGFIVELPAHEVNYLKQNGLKHTVLVEDLSAFYENQIYAPVVEKTQAVGCKPSPVYNDPVNFTLGSMGGYYTYDEAMAILDSMRAKYPQYISAKFPISSEQTHEGRQIYGVRISDNPDVDENEPEMLYTALHHCREAASLTQLIYYMWYLLENANQPDIQFLLQNTELYFVPMVNPDGYVYNETTNPAGGGMWRKNRRPMQNNTYGVDLNRNYGHEWGYDDTGSSPDSTSDTYRGPYAFSEPETRAVRDFCLQHNFQIALNYHTYSNLLIYPWGYIASYQTPDSMLFRSYAQLLTQYNGYVYGTGDETVGYITNGDSDDWMYGEQTQKNKIFSMTPEVGNQNDGFWPAQARILPLARENLFPNLTAAKLLLRYGVAKQVSPIFVEDYNYAYKFKFQRLGLQDGGTYTVSLQPLTANIVSVGSARSYNNPPLIVEQLDSISITLHPSTQPSEKIQFLVVVQNGSFISTDTVTQYFYGGTIVFASDCSSLTNWTTTTWGVSNGTLTESPSGNYPNNSTRALTSSYFNASQADALLIKFDARWDIEKGYDFVAFQISDSGSGVWQNLCGRYTRMGTQYQLANEPIYDGVQSSWITENIIVPTSIFQTNPQKVRIRFRFQSDGAVTGDGFRLDNVEVRKIQAITTTNNPASSEQKPLVLPNPFGEELYFYYAPVGAVLRLYNAQGQRVLDITCQQTQGVINTSQLPAGWYYFTLQAPNQPIFTGKLVKP